MMFFKKRKDGGKESTVTGYWLVEMKSLFSICLLKFEGRSREAFHTHAFNAVSWVLKGSLTEHMKDGRTNHYKPSFKPVWTPRSNFHKVDSDGTTVVLTFRGPWANRWKEWLPNEERFVTLTHGRKIVA